MSTEQIERELLKLPASERARLAERLIASLDEEGEVDLAWIEEPRRRDKELGVDLAWIEEARRRDEGLESGAVEALPLEDSLRDLRSWGPSGRWGRTRHPRVTPTR